MENKLPPKWMGNMLERVCPVWREDEVIGDFYENYDYNLRKKGRLYANKKALIFLLITVPKLLLTQLTTTYNHLDMLKNYILIAFRNIKKRLTYSLINITGLAIGVACCLLIGLYVFHETSYDDFHEDVDQLHRVNLTFTTPQGSRELYMTPTALLPKLQREFNEVETGVRLLYSGAFSAQTVQKGSEINQEKEFFYADSTFFDVFTFPLVAGNSETALTEPGSIVITENVANRYFGTTDVLNAVLKVNGRDHTITGVTKNIPDNSHFTFDFIVSFSTHNASKSEIWGSANYATYVKLASGTDAGQLADDFVKSINEEVGDGFGPISIDIDFMPVEDIHLYSSIPEEMQPQNSIEYVYVISFIGILILVIACINYMNLATARSLDRAREVGMRKVLGAERRQVFFQFIGESFVIVFIAIVISLLIVCVFLTPFNSISGKSFELVDLFSKHVLIALGLTLILVTILAGGYPAIALSAFDPSTVLKGVFKRSKAGNFTRQILVVCQFAISITLVVGTFVVSNQIDYMRNKRLGYNKDNVLVIPSGRYSVSRFNTVKTQLKELANVEGVAIATESPVNIGGGYSIEVPELLEESIPVNAVGMYSDFVKTMEIKLLAGRDFSENDVETARLEKREDRRYAFIVNQKLLDNLLVDEDRAIGLRATLNGRQGEIVGVMENFHSTSLHREISPMVFFAHDDWFNQIFIRIKPDDIQKTIIELESKWREIVPEEAFVFEFMDQQYDDMYRAEIKLGNVFKVFAILAIVIACLGLFGLVSFAVEQRSKEIGIRKVLGASVSGIVKLLAVDFAKLVVFAFIIATPLAWYFMDEWLSDFAYKVDISPIAYGLSGLILLAIAMAIVSMQSIRAATSNPITTLRND